MRTGDYWLTVAVESGGSWPLKDTPIKFLGRDLILIAETEELAQRVAIRCLNQNEFLDALRIIRKLLSVFAWVEEQPIRELFNAGAAWPMRLGKGPHEKIRPWPPPRQFSNVFFYDYLPELTDPRAWLALALFREALNVDSLHYRFLSYYKIINILHKAGKPNPKKGGPAQVTWINQTIPKLQDWEAQKRIKEIQPQVTDIGVYLYESGRCSIAHAYGNPVADPDDPKDTMRLSQDLPLVKALAEHAIEYEFGIKPVSTIIREHLYELAGFHSLLGDEISTKLKTKSDVDLSTIPGLPNFDLRATRYDRVVEFKSFSVKPFAVGDGCLVLEISSPDKLVVWRIILDFPNERLGFDPYQHSACYDDGSPRAVQYALTNFEFKEILILNGRLEIWNSVTGKCLGKTDPYIPRNIDSGRTLQNLFQLKDALETLLWIRNSPFVGACDI